MVDPVPVTETSETDFLFVLIAVTAAYGMLIAEGVFVMYAVACTDKIDENRAVPPEVPSEVGYAVATPLLPDTATVPYQVPIVAGTVGAPLAAVEGVLEPEKNLG